MRSYWGKLMGTAGGWFLFDITFYGNSLFQPTVLHEARGRHPPPLPPPRRRTTSTPPQHHPHMEVEPCPDPPLHWCRRAVLLCGQAQPQQSPQRPWPPP
jgi:hypothetical protein